MLAEDGSVVGGSQKGIRIDPNRRAGTQELKAAVKALAEFLGRHEVACGRRTRARTEAAQAGLLRAVESIVCNFVWIMTHGLDRPLAVPRSSGVMWSSGRYRIEAYGQHFLDALDLMSLEGIDVIEVVALGFGGYANSTGQRTTIRPGAAFAVHIPKDQFSRDAIARDAEPEAIVLKGRKDRKTGRSEFIDYQETASTRRMRKEIIHINRALQAASFWIDAPADRVLWDDDESLIDLTRRSVRRIFNNGSWNEGGRLFDGFWETMRRDDRKRFLRIATAAHPEGESTIEVDFSALFPSLAYSRVNATLPDGDLYGFGQEDWPRDGLKQVLNAMLIAGRPLRNWPEDTRQLFPQCTAFRTVATAIKEYHAPIASLFGSGVGLKLMRLESELLINALLRLYAQNVAALPMHDGIIVGGSEQSITEDAMRAALKDLGLEARVRLKAK